MGSPVLPPVPAPALGPSVPPAEPGAPGVAAQPPPSGGGGNSGVTSGVTRGTAWLSSGLCSARGWPVVEGRCLPPCAPASPAAPPCALATGNASLGDGGGAAPPAACGRGWGGSSRLP